jgi:hypothetical protein
MQWNKYDNEWQTYAKVWWTMLIEFGSKWTLNQLDDFKVINSLNWNPKTQNKGWTLVVLCPMHQN